MNNVLSLQDVVTGFAHVKGTRDIMSNIAYFFELYDDDGDGKVDREGILRISEALLFLSRRGLDTGVSPTASVHELNSPNGDNSRKENRDEQFLSSVSAFIRRCFEYADPDHEINQGQHSKNSEPSKVKEAANAIGAFSIGDDEDDLLDLKSAPSSPNIPKSKSQEPAALTIPTQPQSITKPDTAAANVALDPSKPLHITLPTFRMVILADEILEQFFESSFSNSFKLMDAPPPSSAAASSNLTTFTNVGRVAQSLASPRLGGALGPVGPPGGKGLRGMLDNIVSDGMRVAAEVRRRMEEAQKELDKAAQQQDDEEEEEGKAYGGDAERRSVRERDRELLEGAETEDVETGAVASAKQQEGLLDASDVEADSRSRSVSEGSGKVVEFER
jgi:TBC1 domain family member 8/9